MWCCERQRVELSMHERHSTRSRSNLPIPTVIQVSGDRGATGCNFSRVNRVVFVMKTFLKVGLLVIVAVIVVKCLPLLVAAGFALAGALLGFIALAVSAITALMGSALVLAVLLSPVWLPILALVGVIALIKRSGRKNGGVAA